MGAAYALMGAAFIGLVVLWLVALVLIVRALGPRRPKQKSETPPEA